MATSHSASLAIWAATTAEIAMCELNVIRLRTVRTYELCVKHMICLGILLRLSSLLIVPMHKLDQVFQV